VAIAILEEQPSQGEALSGRPQAHRSQPCQGGRRG